MTPGDFLKGIFLDAFKLKIQNLHVMFKILFNFNEL
jgi:hypothetical protein